MTFLAGQALIAHTHRLFRTADLAGEIGGARAERAQLAWSRSPNVRIQGWVPLSQYSSRP